MNKTPLYVLSAFVLGATSTVFFLLINFEGGRILSSANTTPFLASVIGTFNLPDSATSTPVLSSASSTASPSTVPTFVINMVSATSTPAAPKKYSYKLVRDVDICTMNKLGAQGWQAYQFGGNLESYYGTDENCKNGKVYDTILDWVLFSSDNQ